MEVKKRNIYKIIATVCLIYISLFSKAASSSTGTLICSNDTICPGDSITITVQNPSLPIQWNDGSAFNSIKVAPLNTTTYYVIENFGSSNEDTLFLTVTVINVLTFIDIHPGSICLGDTSYVDLIHANGLYYWSSGDTMIAYVHLSPTVTTDYYVINTAGTNCADTINFTIGVYPRSTSNIFYKDTVCQGESVTLSLEKPVGNIIWTDSIPGNDLSFIPLSDTSLTVINDYLGLCPDTMKVKIVVRPPDEPLENTNVFTPNGDKVNDIFSFENDKNKSFRHLSIFNRWGTLIYDSSEPVLWWDGTYMGTPVSEGTYYYILEYVNECTKKNARSSSFVTLIR